MATPEQVAEINAGIARAMIRAMGMVAENMQREHLGESMAYLHVAFEGLIAEEGIGYNDIISALYH